MRKNPKKIPRLRVEKDGSFSGEGFEENFKEDCPRQECLWSMLRNIISLNQNRKLSIIIDIQHFLFCSILILFGFKTSVPTNVLPNKKSCKGKVEWQSKDRGTLAFTRGTAPILER